MTHHHSPNAATAPADHRAILVTRHVLDLAVRNERVESALEDTILTCLALDDPLDYADAWLATLDIDSPLVLVETHDGVLQPIRALNFAAGLPPYPPFSLQPLLEQQRLAGHPLPAGVEVVYNRGTRLHTVPANPAHPTLTLAAAARCFAMLDWRAVDERGTWEADFQGEVLTCPQSANPATNEPRIEEIALATRCQTCGGRLQHGLPRDRHAWPRCPHCDAGADGPAGAPPCPDRPPGA